MALPIAERWFEIKQIDAAITLLWEPYLHPVWQSNIWHVRGRDRDLLIDAGMGIGDLAATLAEFVTKPLLAVGTHRHADHVGGLHQFETRYAHALDAEEIAQPTSFVSLVVSEYPKEFVAFLRSEGHAAADELVDAYPHEGYDTSAYIVKPAPPTMIVDEGDVIDLGDRAFTVMHLPGHSPGSIGLWDEDAGVLFAGDAVYDGPLYDFLPESNIADYVETMHRLRDLPVSVVHGGHDGSFDRARLIEIAETYIARRGAAAAELLQARSA